MSKDSIIQKEKQRAGEKVKYHDSFIARNYWLWVLVAFVAYPISSILSALTEGGHIFLRMQATGSPIIAWSVTILLVILIESLKFILGKGAIDDLQADVFSSSGSFIAAFFVKALGFLGVMGFSIYLSVSGAPDINEHLRKKMKPVAAEYIDTDAIDDQYDQRALPHRDNIDKYEKTTWNNKIVKEALRAISAEQKTIAAIEARRDTALAAARLANAQILEEWKAKTEKNGNYLTGFAGLGEIICIFCLIFIGIYDDGLKNEADVAAPPPSSLSGSKQRQQPDLLSIIQALQQQGFHQVTNNSPPPDQKRRPIGFFGDAEMRRAPSPSDEREPDWKEENQASAKKDVQRSLNVSSGGKKIVDVRYFKARAKQTFKRSKNYKTEKSRHYQYCLYENYRKELESIGFRFEETEDELFVTEPGE